MPKLSDFDDKDIQLLGTPEETAHALRISQLAPDEVKAGPNFSPLQSAGLGAVQGATLGFGDELEGGAKALAGKATGSPRDLKDLYQEYRDMARQRNDIAKAQNPKSYLGGNLAGGLATGVATGGLSEGVGGAAALGALTGLGSSNADLTKGDVKGAAIDTGVGAGLGAAAGAIGNKIGSALNPQKLEQNASAAAIRGLGGKATPENLAVGRTVLNTPSTTGGSLLPIFGGTQATAEGITGKIGQLESQVQPMLQSVSENAAFPQVSLAKGPISDEVDNLANNFKAGLKTDKAAKIGQSVDESASYWGNELNKAGNDPYKLNQLRKDIDEQAKAAGAFGASEDTKPLAGWYRQLSDTVNKNLRDTASQVSEGLGSDIKSTMGTQSKLIQAQGIANKTAAGDINAPPGPSVSDLGTLGLGKIISASNPVLGEATTVGAVGKMGAELGTGLPIGRLGNVVSARTQDWAAKQLATPSGQAVMKGITKIPQASLSSTGVQTGIQNVYTAKPAQLQQAAQTLIKDDSTKDLGNALNAAIQNGDEDAKNKVLFAAEQLPGVRAKFRAALGTTVATGNSGNGDDIDDFLNSVSQNESSGGTNFNHKMITSGPQIGQTAIGSFGLLPNTVREVLNRDKDPSLDGLRDMSDEELKNELEQSPTTERQVARKLAERVITNQGGDMEKAAYAWRHGHNMKPERIESEDYRNDPYVKSVSQQLANR